MGSYTEDELRQFLTISQKEDGMLTADQISALLGWDGTPEQLRDVLSMRLDELERHAASTKPEPLRPDQEADHRE